MYNTWDTDSKIKNEKVRDEFYTSQITWDIFWPKKIFS